MAAPNRLSVDEEFRNANYNPQSLGDSRGIRNAAVTRMPADARRGRPTITSGTSLRRSETEALEREFNSVDQTTDIAQAAVQTAPREKGRRGFIAETITVNVARVRALPVATGISVWAIPCYFFFMLPLGVMALAAFAAAIAVEYFTNTTAGTVTEAMIEQVYGLNFSAFMVIYLALSALICFFYWIQIIIASIMFKAAFIKPWFGRGTAFKTGSILLIFISSFVPMIQLFPLLGLWVFAVVTNPK